MTVTIREADLGDLDAIVAFGEAVVPDHYTPILGRRPAQAQLAWWTPENFGPAIEAGRVQVAIADRRDVVGVCQTGDMDGAQVVWKLYLAPEYRGRSLGVQLLHQAIASLPARTERVDVEHFAGNTSAGRFYEREGFEVLRTDPAPMDQLPGNGVIWRRLQLSS